MDASQIILIATPQADVAQRLENSFREAGFGVNCVSDLDACLQELGKSNTWSLVMDSQLMNTGVGRTCSMVTEAVGALEGGFLALYNPEKPFDFKAAQAGGVNQFVAYPGPEDLILCHLGNASTSFALDKQAGGSTGFVALDVLQRQVERSITEARAKDRNVAVLSIGFADVGLAKHWVGMDHAMRAEVEQWMQGSLGAFLERDPERSAILGVSIQDLRMAWTRPDRIMMLVPGLARVQDVAKLGAGLQEAIQSAPASGIGRFFTSVAMGVALCPGDSTGSHSLMDCAMRATDRARSEGSTSLTFCTESMGLWAFERLTLEDSLHNALMDDEFRIHYQPRVDAQTSEILGVEALVRWVHPQLGMVSPAQFIPLAEETGLIVPIGEWVLREACKQNQRWRDAGFRPIRVSVNLSPVQFRDACLTDLVDSALEESGLDTDGLELEVTESMLMNDPNSTIQTLKELKERGLKISIDDFGTGYSSLSYLKQFPIDSLKIDRSFIRDVTTNSDDAAITTAVILMGHSLKLNVVAEGVETESQLAFLQVLQCNEIQGFLFSPPLTADRLEAILPKAEADVPKIDSLRP